MKNIDNDNTYKPYSFSVSVLKIMAILSFVGGLYAAYFYIFELSPDLDNQFVDMQISAYTLQKIKTLNIATGLAIGATGITLSAVLSLLVGIFKKVVWNE